MDISSAGRTLIKRKTEMFNRLDVEENLVVLLLMLPSANRQNKETLKVFRDQGGFTDFSPEKMILKDIKTESTTSEFGLFHNRNGNIWNADKNIVG